MATSIHPPPDQKASFILNFITGSFSACTAESVVFPMDLTKTRMQIQGEIYSSSGGPRKGIYQTAKNVVKKEGFFKLWHGLPPALCRHVTYSGARIALYKQLRDALFDRNVDGRFALWKSSVCGAIAGGTAQFLASPFDLVKVQMQMDGFLQLDGKPARIHGVVHGLRKIYSRGGIKALWNGWLPNVQRAAVVNLADIGTYDTTKRMLKTHFEIVGFPAQFIAGLTAGLAGTLIGAPMDVLKARVMNQPVNDQGRGIFYKGTIDCLQKSVKNESFLVLYNGFLPMWMKLGPFTVIFWLTLEQSRKIAGVEGF